MPISHLLEDFSHPVQDDSAQTMSDLSLEDTRLASFEQGYQAGWEDASAAHSSDQTHIAADLARNLQDLSLTYQEACSHVIRSLNPLLTQMAESVLPVLAHQTLGARILADVMEMAKTQTETHLVLTLSPESRSKIETLLEARLPMPVRLIEDAALGDGQVYLKLGTDERSIDMDGLLAGIGRAMTGFFTDTQGEPSHG